MIVMADDSSSYDVTSLLQTVENLQLDEKEDEWEEDTPQKRRKSRRPRNEKEIEAERHFTRKNGMIYVPADLWSDYKRYAFNCQLYISSAPAEHSDIYREELGVAENINVTRSPASRSSPTREYSSLFSFYSPDQMRISNKLLHHEMKRTMGVNDLNYDHVPPFRAIVPFEKQFRTLHQAKEVEFTEMALRNPGHKSVLRTVPKLPRAFGAYLDNKNYEDNTDIIDKTRILLDGLRSLVSFLDNDIADLIECYHKIQAGTIEKIPFAYLWHLFIPGEEIVTREPNYQVWRVSKVTGGRRDLVPQRGNIKDSPITTISDLTIHCFHLDFDGNRIGPVSQQISIKPYDGLLHIKSVGIYPLRCEKGLEQRLIERGEKFVELALVTHRRYNGLSLKEGNQYSWPDEIDSDVVIDFGLAFRNSEPKLEPPVFAETGVLDKHIEIDKDEAQKSGEYFADEEPNKSKWSDFVYRKNLLELQPLDNRQRNVMILLPYRVYGYALLNRKWYPLDIDLIGPVIQRDKDGFDKLVLPPGHKDIVRALVKTHARVGTTSRDNIVKENGKREFDIVKGKGKGLIILLHGAPGVGKTSTAECVSAQTGRPLFPITCGDISGFTAQDVERNLERFFDLARKWGCILLLDEADIFLSERIKGDIRQNSLVSIFLRVLEYYSGILILTTNRIGDFDEAVRSRVHCALYYPPLSKSFTRDVWRKNIDLLKDQNRTHASEVPIQFDRKEIMQFAKDHWKEGNRWNGRQIKNAFQTAAALAIDENIQDEDNPSPKLLRKHFETVAAASEHFDKYLTEVRNTDQFRARTNEVRRDDFGSDMKAYGREEPAQSSRVPRPTWPYSDRESTTDTSEDDSEVSEHEKKKKKKKDRDEQNNKKKGQRSNPRSDKKLKKQEDVKSRSKDKSSKRTSSQKKKEFEQPSSSSEFESESESEQSNIGPG